MSTKVRNVKNIHSNNNTMQGWAIAMTRHCENIRRSPTTTDEARQIAAEIYIRAHQLSAALKIRRS